MFSTRLETGSARLLQGRRALYEVSPPGEQQSLMLVHPNRYDCRSPCYPTRPPSSYIFSSPKVVAASVPRLPPELLFSILDLATRTHLRASTEEWELSRRTLCSAALVSSTWTREAQRLLFRSVRVETRTQAQRIARATQGIGSRMGMDLVVSGEALKVVVGLDAFRSVRSLRIADIAPFSAWRPLLNSRMLESKWFSSFLRSVCY
jgi:hypothetical protein